MEMESCLQLKNLKKRLNACLAFYNQYKFITETYIIEYFSENHWKNLPKQWQDVLDNFQPSDLAEELLKSGNTKYKTVWPLSLLAFKQAAHGLALPRFYCSDSCKTTKDQNILLNLIFERNVKVKKQHEIRNLSKIIAKTFNEARCTSVIDVGSGQGHLSRALSIGYKLPVVAIEHDAMFVERAKLFDVKALQRMKEKEKKLDFLMEYCTKQHFPRHNRYTVLPDVDHQTFVRHINSMCQAVSEHHRKERYLLTGLHACGDLSATMVRLFKENEDIKALVSVACCYMKLTTDHDEKEKVFSIKSLESDGHYCYPMSNHVKGLDNHVIPYESRKVACDAVEGHIARLEKDNGAELKIHCYRAVLEYLIRLSLPDLIRTGIQTVKKAYLLPFSEYAEQAFIKLKLPISHLNEHLNNVDVEAMLRQWRNVVTFFTLSLMVGPVVETIILLDRMIHLAENDIPSEIVQMFDPLLSSRCFAIFAKKSIEE